MLIIGATPEQIREAARETGVALRGNSTWVTSGRANRADSGLDIRQRGKGLRFRIQLCTAGERTPSGRLSKRNGPPRYRRLSERPDGRGGVHEVTIPGAVCWHGHRDFFRALFRVVPDAEIRTALATYKGAQEFERIFEPTGDRVVARWSGQTLRATCECER